MGTKKILSKKQTADFFGITIRTLDNWSKKGALTPIKIVGSVYFRTQDIEALINPLNASTDE